MKSRKLTNDGLTAAEATRRYQAEEQQRMDTFATIARRERDEFEAALQRAKTEAMIPIREESKLAVERLRKLGFRGGDIQRVTTGYIAFLPRTKKITVWNVRKNIRDSHLLREPMLGEDGEIYIFETRCRARGFRPGYHRLDSPYFFRSPWEVMDIGVKLGDNPYPHLEAFTEEIVRGLRLLGQS